MYTCSNYPTSNDSPSNQNNDSWNCLNESVSNTRLEQQRKARKTLTSFMLTEAYNIDFLCHAIITMFHVHVWVYHWLWRYLETYQSLAHNAGDYDPLNWCFSFWHKMIRFGYKMACSRSVYHFRFHKQTKCRHGNARIDIDWLFTHHRCMFIV